ncbi:Uncharacterised protein [Streptococcus pneumoniae]|nr:Uncharacterised protein [Streptococcus pneumoniae]
MIWVKCSGIFGYIQLSFHKVMDHIPISLKLTLFPKKLISIWRVVSMAYLM